MEKGIKRAFVFSSQSSATDRSNLLAEPPGANDIQVDGNTCGKNWGLPVEATKNGVGCGCRTRLDAGIGRTSQAQTNE